MRKKPRSRLKRELELRVATLFVGPELADTVWNAERALRIEGVRSVKDPRFDRILGDAIAVTLNYLFHQHVKSCEDQRPGRRIVPAPRIHVA